MQRGATRRRFLTGAAAAGGVLLAGCSGGGDGGADATATTGSVGTTAATPGSTDGPTTGTTASTGTPDATGTAGPDPVGTAVGVVERLAAREWDAAREPFSERLRSAVGRNRLARVWLGVAGQHGGYRGVEDRRRESTGEGTRVVLTLSFAEATQRVRFAVANGRVTGLLFPNGEYGAPAYADRSSFAERSVTVDDGDCPLPGTLSVPAGGPSPGVVVVHGSGAHDRDGTIGPNKPYRDLAWGLASRGVAVLRYEKETRECDLPPAERTLDDVTVDDAVAAASVLRSAGGVRADATFVCGHSMGAAATPRILDRDPDLAGGVMLAAPARDPTTLVAEQVRHRLSADGTVTDAERSRLDRVRAQLDRIEAGDVEDGEEVLGYAGAWWNSYREYDPVATARALSRPLSLAQGGRDWQVDPEADFGRWRDTLDGATFRSYPSLNHLFQSGAGPSTLVGYRYHDNVARAVVEDIATWVRGRA